MDTTSPAAADEGLDVSALIERLAAVDAAEAPDVADEIASRLGSGLDDPASRQLEADFGGETGT